MVIIIAMVIAMATIIVLVEAMAMGLPVVATRVGSIPELVDNGTTGFLVRPHWQHPVEWEEEAVHVVSEGFVDEIRATGVEVALLPIGASLGI